MNRRGFLGNILKGVIVGLAAPDIIAEASTFTPVVKPDPMGLWSQIPIQEYKYVPLTEEKLKQFIDDVCSIGLHPESHYDDRTVFFGEKDLVEELSYNLKAALQ